MNLINININEFEKELYSYYVEIFPEEERKPLKLLQSSYQKGYMKIIKIVNGGSLVGFMILNGVKDKGYVVLDYFAILPLYRDKGFGTKAMELLIEQKKENDGIFVEIEKIGLGKDETENLQREKRQKFYEKLGFQKLNFDLLLFDVLYMPYLFSNNDIDEEIVRKEILNIYEAISGKERIEQNCKIIRNLKFVEIEYKDLEQKGNYDELINKVIAKCFETENLQNTQLYVSIILTTPNVIKQTNREYRNIDQETDVLSFPMFEKEEIYQIAEEEVLGDIMISLEQVKVQAEEYGHSFERELAYMLVHGFYHLMGEDHMQEDEKIRMRKKEESVLNQLNIVRE